MSSTKEDLRQILAILTIFLNNSSAAISSGWVGPVLKNLQSSGEYFTLNADQSSWIASLPHLSSIFGALLSAFLLDNVGRKFLLSVGAFAHLISWFIILFTHSIPLVYLARLGVGLAIGISSVVNSIYLGEISSPKNRDGLGYAMILFYNSAFVVTFSIATYFSYHTTALFGSIIHVFFTLSTLFIVEPPQFLLMKNKFQRAEKNFLWLKGLKNADDYAVKEELEKLKNNAYTEVSKKSSYIKLLTYPAIYKSLLIVILFSILEGFSGYYPITYFAPTVFTSNEILTLSEFFIILRLFKIVWSFFLIYIIHPFNRRSILLLASIVGFFGHISIAILCYLNDERTIKIRYFPLLIFVFITLFMAAHPIFHTISILLRGELFSLSIKPLGNCISVIFFSASDFLSVKIFLFIKSSYGVYINFLIFSAVCLMMSLFAYFIIPDTSNKSLIEIQEMLENKTKRNLRNISNV